MMGRSGIRRSRVATVLIGVMVVSMTGLFGATGPTAKITSPASGARVSGEVEVRAAVKASSSVSYVILGVDQERPCATNSSPYRFWLDTRSLPDGRHRLFVEAYDAFGLIASSKAITIYVRNAPPPPVAATHKDVVPSVVAKSTPAKTAQRAVKSTLPAAASVVAGGSPGKPKTSAEAAGAQFAASPAPTALGRGPMPEPSSVAAGASPTPNRASAPAVSSYASVNAGVISDLPPTAGRAGTPAPRSRVHTIMLDGKVVDFDVAPAVVNGRLQAGFRALFSATGGYVSWIPQQRTARSASRTLVVEVPVGSTRATVNGRAVDIGAVATVRAGRTIIPVRFFADASGATVNWEAETLMARLSTTPRAVSSAKMN